MSDDPVLDYMVMEAIAFKAAEEDREAEKNQERESWKKDFSGLRERLAAQ